MTLTKKGAYVLYVVFTILCLEHVRRKYNGLTDMKRKYNWSNELLGIKKNMLLIIASMIYGTFLSFIALGLITSLIQKITNTYTDATFLKTNLSLVIVIVLSYFMSVVFVRILLNEYIKFMNRWTNFWNKLKRSPWDGSKIVVQTTEKVGGVLINGVYKSAQKGRKGIKIIGRSIGNVSKKALRPISRRVRRPT